MRALVRTILPLRRRPSRAGGICLLLIVTVGPSPLHAQLSELLVDGEQVGRTGPDGQAYATNLAPGSHRVVVRKEGYESASRTEFTTVYLASLGSQRHRLPISGDRGGQPSAAL